MSESLKKKPAEAERPRKTAKRAAGDKTSGSASGKRASDRAKKPSAKPAAARKPKTEETGEKKPKAAPAEKPTSSAKGKAASATKKAVVPPEKKAPSKKAAAPAVKKATTNKTVRAAKKAPAKKAADTDVKPNKVDTPAKSAGKYVAGKHTAGKHAAGRVKENPVAVEANRKQQASARRSRDDLFMEKKPGKGKKKSGGGVPPKGIGTLFDALNACLVIAIAVLAALGVHQRGAYAEFKRMRDVVDQQTFYDGTTVEGVDVSRMTLSNAIDYWRDRVEQRYEDRAAVLDDGTTVTARELGYSSDYESVLSAAWSAGRNGSLEERYRMASARRDDPVAYSVTRVDYDEALLDQFAQTVAVGIDQPAMDATVADFNAETYEFSFNESQVGRKLDTDALKASVAEAIRAGGGNVALEITETQPAITTEEVATHYGLIDYAITNANSSSRARINNIKLAMSFINGRRVAPGETFSFNEAVGQRTSSRGFKKATAYSGGEVTEQVGGGICQVSTTLFNAAVKADMEIVERHNHSLTVHYVDKGKDATVDWGHQDFKFKNTSDDDVFICCYLTDDKRVRFGIFGRLLPNGEKITVEAVTTEVIKYDTEYQKSPLLGAGETYVAQDGRNGYKAEAYKVRWDADGNQLSKELLCKSYYKVKDEIIQYGA